MRKSVLAIFLLSAGVSHAQPSDDSWNARLTSPEFLIGSGLFIGGYGATVLYGTQSDLDYGGALYVPVVGPWIELFDLPDCGGPDDDLVCQYPTEDAVALALTGAAQVAGVGLMTYALLRHREPAPILIAPSYAGGAAGFKISGKF
jgi:hypothetical protein